MEYHPRLDSSDKPLDSDDRWLTLSGLQKRVDTILHGHESTTVGIAEVPLTMSSRCLDRRLARWEPRMRHLARVQEVGEVTVYHWSVAELIAHEALHEWWSAILEWPLGWWPTEHAGEPPGVPERYASPRPYSTFADDQQV